MGRSQTVARRPSCEENSCPRTPELWRLPLASRFCKQVVLDKRISEPGDSGGPYFWSDRAHGITMGAGSVSYFSAISSLNTTGTTVYRG
jgi:hypothetical protein